MFLPIWLLQQSAVLLAFWREIQPTDVCKVNVSQPFIQKDLKYYFTPMDEEQAHGATKMNKEQSADDPSVDLIR